MFITINGAKENNLKNISLQIPKNKLIVFTGLSGSGKSTLALETLQRECQRQYMESMGLTMDIGSKPKVDSIKGLSPAISINQYHGNNNPRSTVGTTTEIATYLRVLYAKLGERPCLHCEKIITQNYDDIESSVYTEQDSDDTESAELFEQTIPCPHCNKQVIELTASHFSFNKPEGACTTCRGVGMEQTPDINLLIDMSKSICEFAIHGWDQVYIDRYGGAMVQASKHYGLEFDINAPINQYNDIQMDLLLYGVLSQQFSNRFPNITPPKTVPSGRFEGVVTNLMRRYAESSSTSARQKIEKFLIQQSCTACHGVKFRKETLQVKVGGINIKALSAMSLIEVGEWLQTISQTLSFEALEVVGQILDDINRKIERIISVGAGYLRLDQPSMSLSAGELQRIKLASILGSGLTGVLYVLDEPTAGLHARDTGKIIEVLRQLCDMGNTVIVIEHDVNIMKASDYIVDFGPGAGKLGGQIVASGTVSNIINCKASITGKYLVSNGNKTKRNIRHQNSGYIEIKKANKNNLKNIDVQFPLGKFVSVTGVSGSGKSSLVFEVLAEKAESYFKNSKKIDSLNIVGLEQLDDVIIINQHSIGRSSRSNTATYTDLFTDIRDLYASLPETKPVGLTAKHFSYNVAGGRCEKCQGIGKLSISMHFLPDVEVACPACRGKRYQKTVLNIHYKNKSIADVLELSIDEALDLFNEEESIKTKLVVLQNVGLGYLSLGQSTATLSGGEAQRLKLAKELTKKSTGKTLYLFDEPTTGLHPHDVGRIINVLDQLVCLGNSVIVIEHNPDIILASDWVIDLGPEGGNLGGEVTVQGPLEEILRSTTSVTGKVLSELYSS